jgi:hypothetical protein
MGGIIKNPIALMSNGVTWLHIASRKGFKKKPLNVSNKKRLFLISNSNLSVNLKGKFHCAIWLVH